MANADLACCPGARWTELADLGHALAFDAQLGRCSHCARHWMLLHSSVAADSVMVAVEPADAASLQASAPGPQRKQRLKQWIDAVL